MIGDADKIANELRVLDQVGREADAAGLGDEAAAVGLGLEIALDLGFPRIDLGDRAGDGVGVEGVVEHEESALVVRLRLVIADDFERRLHWAST